MVSISGLGSGLDTQSIIAQLVQIEQQKINVVSARGNRQTQALSSWTTIRSTLTALNGVAAGLLKASDWQALSATSSDETTATVSAGSGTLTGSLSFTVSALAQTGVLRSASTMSSLAARITNDAAIFVATGGGKLGFTSLASNDSVALGTHTIVVTQSSAAAHKVGSGVLAASTVIDNSNNALQIEVNGGTYNLTIASGTYDAQQLATAVQATATAAGAQVAVSLNSAGNLNIDTSAEGAAATLRVTGGTALSALQLATDGAVLTGTNGELTVDGGPTQIFGGTSTLGVGTSIDIAGGGGTITAALAGGLRVGSITANNVSTGDGSVQAVVSAINGAKAGVSAAAIQVGTNAFRLQIGSSTTGAGNDPNLAATEFDTVAIGGLTVLSQASDASITVGSGAGSYNITSSNNTMNNILPGVTVTLKKRNLTTPVTVTVDRNGTALADRVQSLVDAANAVKTEIDRATRYDPATRQSSPLVGDSTAQRLKSSLNTAITSLVAGANPATPGQLGVATDRLGNFTFDKTKFMTAFTADPDGVSKIFGQFGSATSGSMSFIGATARSVPGTYAVNVATAATQASATSSGVPSAGTTVRVKVGTVLAAYTVQSGDSASDVAAGLTSSFAAQNLGVIANASGGNVQVSSSGYGTRSSIDVAWDGTSYATHTGVDIAGTINGVVATGSGQILTAPSPDATLAGISVQVQGTTTGALGSVTYSPGSAARLTRAISLATDSINGYITTRETGITANKKVITEQVDRMTIRINAYSARLRRTYAQLETALSNIRGQGSSLSGLLS